MKKFLYLIIALLVVQLSGYAQTYIPDVVNSIPPGYYNSANGLTCAALKTALFNKISSGTSVLSYTPGLWNAFATTDLHRNDANDANVIWDMYSDNPTGPESFYYTLSTDQCGTYADQGDCYNREHSFPQAWFGNGTLPMFSDLHHVFATDGFTNGKHDNNPYSEVSSASWTSVNGSKLGNNSFPGFTGTVFEPINEYKGDFARATLYMVTRYESDMTSWQNNANAGDILNGTTYPSLKDWYVKLLFKWHTQDPPSAKEINRNDAIYNLQGNRNPFVDHPEFVALIWQCTGLIPVTLIDFKVSKNSGSINLNWTTTKETNFRMYEIERSIDGINFNKIASIAGRNLENYSTTDSDLPNAKTVFYRLKMLDIDGKFSYSKVIAVRLFNSSGALVFPNPATNELTIKLQQVIADKSFVKIADVTGRIVLESKILQGQNALHLNIHSLSEGKYFVTLQSRDTIIQESFIKLK